MIAVRFLRMHPPTESEDGSHKQIPVVLIQMPAAPSVRGVFSALLSALGSPLVYQGTTDARENLALHIMRSVGVRLLMIDELHNLLSCRVNQRRELLNLLRFLGNELRLPLACLGTKEAYFAIRSDDQLENRFEPFLLPRWSDGPELGRLLASFEASIPLRDPSGLSAPAMRSLILKRSEGIIGEMVTLLNATARYVLEQGREYIDADSIMAADYRSPSERRRQFESIVE